MRKPFIDENSVVQADVDIENSVSDIHSDHNHNVTHSSCASHHHNHEKHNHHNHNHGHHNCSHAKKRSPWFKAKNKDNSLQNRFALVLVVTIVFSIVQLILSYAAGSLSLINDAFHQLIDATGIVVCILALRFANKKANSKFTYGYHRLEIIGAICCNLVLIAIMILLVFESIDRIKNFRVSDENSKNSVNSGYMMTGAIISLISSSWIMYLLKSRKDVMEFYKNHDKCCH